MRTLTDHKDFVHSYGNKEYLSEKSKNQGLRTPETLDFTESKRQDLNLRPLRPERSALPN